MVCFNVTIVLYGILLVSMIKGFQEDYKDEFVIRVNTSDFPNIRKELERYNASFLKMIFPEFFLFKDGLHHKKKACLEKAMARNTLLRTKVQHFERVREFTVNSYNDRVVAAAVSSDEPNIAYRLRNSPTFSDMGVEVVWKMGYSGKGIVIAITDAGINTDIPDLQPNIKSDLSFNYATNTTDVTPEQCYVRYSSLPDHGNNCAGVVGATKNEICGDGVAYGASIVATKIFDLTQDSKYHTCSIHFDTSWIAQGLLHRIEKVDVYSNSWGAGKDFIDTSETVANAIEIGVNSGRDGKGAIYVFPADYIADPYANNIHTIAVNSVGTNGRPPAFAKVCACTLTSAYGETSDYHTYVMHTTSYQRGNCTLEFEGTSASTAIVSGIIGLVLQANPDLSWRDVQDLIVKASEFARLAQRNYFQMNGAGHRYHPVLGFGLLNAAKFVKLAKTVNPLPAQLKINGSLVDKSQGWRDHNPNFKCTFEVQCGDTCINRTESVIVKLTYSSQSESLDELILTSPSGTDSLLFDMKQSKSSGSVHRNDKTFKSVNFWGEVAEGSWTLILQHRIHQGNVTIEKCGLIIYGTGFTRSTPPPKPLDTGQVKEQVKTHIHTQRVHETSTTQPSTEGSKTKNTDHGSLNFTPIQNVNISYVVIIAIIVITILVCMCINWQKAVRILNIIGQFVSTVVGAIWRMCEGIREYCNDTIMLIFTWLVTFIPHIDDYLEYYRAVGPPEAVPET